MSPAPVSRHKSNKNLGDKSEYNRPLQLCYNYKHFLNILMLFCQGDPLKCFCIIYLFHVLYVTYSRQKEMCGLKQTILLFMLHVQNKLRVSSQPVSIYEIIFLLPHSDKTPRVSSCAPGFYNKLVIN